MAGTMASEATAEQLPEAGGGKLLDVNNIEVVYNDIVQVLRGVSLNVKEGDVVALLGTNGAGKTTTLRAISGLLKPENGHIRSGHINFDGHDITNVLGTSVVRLGAVMVPEGRRVFKHLSVEENIRAGSTTRKDGAKAVRADMDKMYELFPRLTRDPEPHGRVLLRGRTADDRHRPGAAGVPEDADAR